MNYKKGDKIWYRDMYSEHKVVIFCKYKGDDGFVFTYMDEPDFYWVSHIKRIIGKYNELAPKHTVNKFKL
jgi:hypothetical protein